MYMKVEVERIPFLLLCMTIASALGPSVQGEGSVCMTIALHSFPSSLLSHTHTHTLFSSPIPTQASCMAAARRRVARAQQSEAPPRSRRSRIWWRPRSARAYVSTRFRRCWARMCLQCLPGGCWGSRVDALEFGLMGLWVLKLDSW